MKRTEINVITGEERTVDFTIEEELEAQRQRSIELPLPEILSPVEKLVTFLKENPDVLALVTE